MRLVFNACYKPFVKCKLKGNSRAFSFHLKEFGNFNNLNSTYVIKLL